MPSGNFKTESSRPRLCSCWKMEIGSLKLTEIKLAKKNESSHQASQRGSTEKERNLTVEKCCRLTDLFLKSSAASASSSAHTASTNVSDTAEPAHQGERQDSEEYEREEEQNEQEEVDRL